MWKVTADRVTVASPEHFSPFRLSLGRMVMMARIAWPSDEQRAKVLGGKLRQIGGAYLIPKALASVPGFNWSESRARLQHISKLAGELAHELRSLNPLHAMLVEAIYVPDERSPSPLDLHELSVAAAKLAGEPGRVKLGRRADPLPVVNVRQLISVLNYELVQPGSAGGPDASSHTISRLRGRIVREWFAEVDVTVTAKTRQRLISAARQELRREPGLAEQDRKYAERHYLLSLGKVTPLP